MVQLRIFVGTIAEIEKAFNAWGAALVAGTNINAGPTTPLYPNSTEPIEDRAFTKEVMYVLPGRGNGLAVPAPAQQRPRGA